MSSDQVSGSQAPRFARLSLPFFIAFFFLLLLFTAHYFHLSKVADVDCFQEPRPHLLSPVRRTWWPSSPPRLTMGFFLFPPGCRSRLHSMTLVWDILPHEGPSHTESSTPPTRDDTPTRPTTSCFFSLNGFLLLLFDVLPLRMRSK